jgi:hypothetical protein
MTTLQLIATISLATLVAYVAAGLLTRRRVPASIADLRADWLLVCAWPAVVYAYLAAQSIRASIEETDGLQWRDDKPNKWRDETRDDRAQMGPSPIWIPLLLTLLVILAIVLNELVLHIVPARGPLAAEYAPDPTSQFVLLTVAVATVALMKVVGWYRRRSADG